MPVYPRSVLVIRRNVWMLVIPFPAFSMDTVLRTESTASIAQPLPLPVVDATTITTTTSSTATTMTTTMTTMTTTMTTTTTG